ncbi:hypothetical protein LCGC14_2074490 [marine sediment metagenome]|uniref:Putative regulatory protein FmdB zinc ribbon domain-containing protein n=1 Tax=marine sediment metagenome TaxID=412755 RepID=A0A0F9HEG4_9ZZZZ
MPFYEYVAVDIEKSCKQCYNVFEIRQLISDEQVETCPKCKMPIRKLVSKSGGFIVKGREINQFSDVRHAKYWRDSNGIRHKVTPQDGRSYSPTISNRRKASPEEIQARKRVDATKDKKKRNIDSYNRFKKTIRK